MYLILVNVFALKLCKCLTAYSLLLFTQNASLIHSLALTMGLSMTHSVAE